MVHLSTHSGLASNSSIKFGALVGRCVGGEAQDTLGGWNTAGEVERDAPDELEIAGLVGGGHVVRLHVEEQILVDGPELRGVFEALDSGGRDGAPFLRDLLGDLAELIPLGAAGASLVELVPVREKRAVRMLHHGLPRFFHSRGRLLGSTEQEAGKQD